MHMHSPHHCCCCCCCLLQDTAIAGAKGGHSELAQALMLFIPTAFDLVATVLMNVGLLSGAPMCAWTCLCRSSQEQGCWGAWVVRGAAAGREGGV